MQVQRVHRAARHDVDPAIGHFQFAAAQVPFDGRGESGDVPRELSAQRLESR